MDSYRMERSNFSQPFYLSIAKYFWANYFSIAEPGLSTMAPPESIIYFCFGFLYYLPLNFLLVWRLILHKVCATY